MDELKPCPFCGAEAHFWYPDYEGSADCFVECTNGLCCAQTVLMNNEEEAAKAWNTRHQDNQTIALQSRAITEWQDKCMLLETELKRLQEQIADPTRIEVDRERLNELVNGQKGDGICPFGYKTVDCLQFNSDCDKCWLFYLQASHA